MAKVGGSVLSADFSKVKEWLPQLEKAKPEMIQWDVMDNKYVPNSGVPIEEIKKLRPKTKNFFEKNLSKVKLLREAIDKEGLNCEIQVDGGINAETGKKSVEAGADILIAGSYVIKSGDIPKRVQTLK